MTVVMRAYLRSLIPLTILSVIAFLPVLAGVLRMSVPRDPIQARDTLRWAAVLAGAGIVPLLVLVAGATAALDRPRGSQLAVLVTGLRRMASALVPCVAAVIVISIGALALAVPGAVLLVLLSLTGASSSRGVGAALADSVAAVRARPRYVVTVLAVTVGLAAVLLAAGQRALPMPLPKPPLPPQLAAFRTYARLSIAALALLAPLPALALARARRT